MTDIPDFTGNKILVTGASGFIGARLCRRLGERGAIVHAVSRVSRKADAAQVRWRTGDLTDNTWVDNLLEAIKPDIIFHLASEVTGNRGLEFVLSTLNANLVSSVNMLTAATKVGCARLVMAASLEEPDEQDETPVPCSPYAAAKWAAGGYARMFHALYATPVVMARLFMVYGPGQRDLRKFVPYVTLALLREEAPELTSGHRLVDWIYVEDVVDGLLMAGIAAGVEGRALDIGSGRLTEVRTVAEMLRDIVGGVEPRYGALSERRMERVRVANVAATTRILGWTPTVSLEQGLRKTVDWYKKGFDPAPINSYG